MVNVVRECFLPRCTTAVTELPRFPCGYAMSNDISIDNMMQKALEIPGLLSLAAGFTDNKLAARAHVRALCDELLSSDDHNEVLQYGLPIGRRALREQLAQRLVKQDRDTGASPPSIGADETIITTGSQQALFLAVQALCQPGDIILVEHPTYFVMLDVLRTLGVRAVALPSKNDSLDVDALDAFFQELKENGDFDRVRSVYVISYFSNPSSKSLSLEQKLGLLEKMRAHALHVPVIEDIAYREFYFGEPLPVPSMLAWDTPEIPIFVTGTLTKLFSTGLKVGWFTIRDEKLRQRLIDLKRCQDFGTSNFTQAICELAIERGILDAYLDEVRPLYHAKAEALSSGLRENGLEELGWSWEPAGGALYLWLRAPEGIETGPSSELSRTCLEEKVIYVPGELCTPNGGRERARLSFGSLSPEELKEAARRFAVAAKRVAKAG